MSTRRGRTRTIPWFDRWSYPCLPRGIPLLQRGQGELQIGLDSERVLVLGGAVPALYLWLSRLDGGHHVSALRALAADWSLDDAHIEWVVEVLHQGGLLVEAAHRLDLDGLGSEFCAVSAVRGARIRIIGAADTGAPIALLLAQVGVTALDLVDPEPSESAVGAPAALAATRAEVLARSLTTAPSSHELTAPPQVYVHNHWSKPEGRHIDLTILAADTWESDRIVTDGLLRADQPHLILRSRGDGVLVGPLVVPGRTACLRCTDLARTDADPAWPQLLRQLSRTRSTAGTAVTAWAVATAVTQVLAHLSKRTPETYGATLELSGTDFLVQRRSWGAHPGCGCAWGRTAEWGA